MLVFTIRQYRGDKTKIIFFHLMSPDALNLTKCVFMVNFNICGHATINVKNKYAVKSFTPRQCSNQSHIFQNEKRTRGLSCCAISRLINKTCSTCYFTRLA